MSEKYDVGVLIHFPDDVGDDVKEDLVKLATTWCGQPEADWPFSVGLIPAGDFLGFIFPDPDDANLFVSHAERYLRGVEDPDDVGRMYAVVVCWNGLVGG